MGEDEHSIEDPDAASGETRCLSRFWAGTYLAGTGFNVRSLLVAPDSGYASEWWACVGADHDFGTVAFKDFGLRLTFTSANPNAGLAAIEPDMILVRWGERRYLVPAKRVIGFCNEVNQGSEPRTEAVPSFYLLRTGDEKKKVRGLPELPAEYRDYLLLKPVEATVIAVGAFTTRPSSGDWKYKDTQVTLDAGAKQGLKARMELVVIGPGDVWASTRITKVQENRADAIVTQWGEEEPGPKLGWRLSTRAPK
jgi:hypothetical protein